MEPIFKDDEKRKISKHEEIVFTTKTSGLYLIEISAIVKNEKQLGGTDDEDLKIEINQRKFPTPASFSGGTSKGLKKTIYFILSLKVGKHTISLIPDISATLVKIEVFKISEETNLHELNLPLNDQAEDGDRRAWITFVLVDLSLHAFTVELNLKRRFIDSDDIKVIVDGSIKRNNRSVLHKLWYFAASILTGENQTETFTVNLPKDLHYIEFWADRMPKLEEVIFLELTTQTSTEPEETIQEKIIRKTKEFGLDPELILRLVERESAFNPKAISSVGAKGLFQLTDQTVEQIGNLGFTINDPYDIDQNIEGGLVYFKWLYDRYDGDPEHLEKTLAAWNWGLNNFPKEGPLDYGPMPSETKKFIHFILDK